jgi:hypothetical protein
MALVALVVVVYREPTPNALGFAASETHATLGFVYGPIDFAADLELLLDTFRVYLPGYFAFALSPMLFASWAGFECRP